MSVLIRGMEMPECCAECRMMCEFICRAVDEYLTDDEDEYGCPKWTSERMEWCPLEEVMEDDCR